MNTPSPSSYTEKTFLNSTIILPFPKEHYSEIVSSPASFRRFLEEMSLLYPELFPKQFADGFLMKDIYYSQKLKLYFRRILVQGNAYSIRPSFVMPYMTAFTDDVSNALFLRKFSVPYWALSSLYGKNSMFWYRLETSLGRHSLVATTIRFPKDLPEHIVADEKFSSINKEKAYVATTVAKDCILGAEIVHSVDDEGLEQAYKIFKNEALSLNSFYTPKTVNLDGWKSTNNAFRKLFKKIIIIPCFLHLYLKMRDRCKKKNEVLFLETAEKFWECFKAETKREFAQRTRRLVEWACSVKEMPEELLKGVLKLWKKNEQFQKSYEFEGSHRTSNMVDRLMQRMKNHFKMTKEFHGNRKSATKNIRGWALLQNFSPSHPETIEKHGGVFQSPAERLNQFTYHSHWLHNLLISASKSPPQNSL